MLVERVRATHLIAEGDAVAVMLSGGRDSVCLLDCVVALGARVTALHVNYGLRPEAADDERFCAALCAGLGVSLVVERAGRPPAPGNLQAWAREVRYRAAERLDGRIATGHTASDQAETILYRLASSPGRRALLGMTPREGRVIRPLLGVTRAETARHCEERGLAWREDASNESPAFARNRIRAGLLRDEAAVLDDVVETALAGGDTIAVATLAALPRALARLIVRRLAEDATGRLCARAPARLDDILDLERGALDLGDGVRAVIDEGMLRMVPTPPLHVHA